MTTDQTSDPDRIPAAEKMAFKFGSNRFQLHDILIGSNAFVQRATTEHNLDQLNADALEHCLVSLKPRANLTHFSHLTNYSYKSNIVISDVNKFK